MMGDRAVVQEALFYSFSIENHVPADHLLRSIDRFVDLDGIREYLRPYYSETGRASIDPELMIRMLIIGYCMGIRSERRLCEEVHLNLVYRPQHCDDRRLSHITPRAKESRDAVCSPQANLEAGPPAFARSQRSER
jgi:hypothetical protein